MNINEKAYATEQTSDAKKLLELYERVPADKRQRLLDIMEGLIAGMSAQERLAS